MFIPKYLLYLLILRCSMLILFSECASCSNLFLPSSVGYILHNFNILYLKIFLVSMSVLILKDPMYQVYCLFSLFFCLHFLVKFSLVSVSFGLLIFPIFFVCLYEQNKNYSSSIKKTSFEKKLNIQLTFAAFSIRCRSSTFQ